MDKDKFTPILFRTLGFEGGVDNHSIGGSGISNHGVTQRTYDSYTKQKKLPQRSVLDLKADKIRDFYYDDLYKRPKIDKLPDNISAVAFDYAVQSGDDRAVRSLQKIVGSKEDGLIGKNTLKSIKKYIADNGEGDLINKYINEREAFLNGLVVDNPLEHGRNAQGYINRMNKLRNDFLAPNE